MGYQRMMRGILAVLVAAIVVAAPASADWKKSAAKLPLVKPGDFAFVYQPEGLPDNVAVEGGTITPKRFVRINLPKGMRLKPHRLTVLPNPKTPYWRYYGLFGDVQTWGLKPGKRLAGKRLADGLMRSRRPHLSNPTPGSLVTQPSFLPDGVGLEHLRASGVAWRPVRLPVAKGVRLNPHYAGDVVLKSGKIGFLGFPHPVNFVHCGAFCEPLYIDVNAAAARAAAAPAAASVKSNIAELPLFMSGLLYQPGRT
jgi:hypothetical protein